MLEVRSLGRRYEDGGVLALSGVSFDAGAGQAVALTGPSGCGKSTLLGLLGMLDRPTEGRISLAGRDYGQVRGPHAFRAREIGFVFQFHHLVATMTLQENVEAPLVALGMPRKRRAERALELLHAMDLQDRAAFLPAHVSGGERQRAAVARALVHRPPLLLADEPTGNLDSANGDRVVALLVQHARAHGALVLIATHNPQIAASLDRRIEMLDGRLALAPARYAAHALSQPAFENELLSV